MPVVLLSDLLAYMHEHSLHDVDLYVGRALDDHRYNWCTPINCLTFGYTQGSGTHFSFLLTEEFIAEMVARSHAAVSTTESQRVKVNERREGEARAPTDLVGEASPLAQLNASSQDNNNPSSGAALPDLVNSPMEAEGIIDEIVRDPETRAIMAQIREFRRFPSESFDPDELSRVCPIVVTCPDGGQSRIVGENLYDFLCLGSVCGFLAIEQFTFKDGEEDALQAYLEPNWRPTKQDHYGSGLAMRFEHEARAILDRLITHFQLKPWCGAEHYRQLNERYRATLIWPTDQA